MSGTGNACGSAAGSCANAKNTAWQTTPRKQRTAAKHTTPNPEERSAQGCGEVAAVFRADSADAYCRSSLIDAKRFRAASAPARPRKASDEAEHGEDEAGGLGN